MAREMGFIEEINGNGVLRAIAVLGSTFISGLGIGYGVNAYVKEVEIAELRLEHRKNIQTEIENYESIIESHKYTIKNYKSMLDSETIRANSLDRKLSSQDEIFEEKLKDRQKNNVILISTLRGELKRHSEKNANLNKRLERMRTATDWIIEITNFYSAKLESETCVDKSYCPSNAIASNYANKIATKFITARVLSDSKLERINRKIELLNENRIQLILDGRNTGKEYNLQSEIHEINEYKYEFMVAKKMSDMPLSKVFDSYIDLPFKDDLPIEIATVTIEDVGVIVIPIEPSKIISNRMK